MIPCLMNGRTAPDLRRVFTVWWPLAASWLMMGFELPAVSAFMARLPDPELNLAAYGGVVFPVALIVEAPIIMLLAASTALCKDRASYLKIRRFMFTTAGALTVLHVLVAATPLYDFVVGRVIGAPEEIRGPARVGLLIMTPWTASIAYRRFQQGVLIRFGKARLVGIGTAVRLGTNLAVLITGYTLHSLPGIVVGTAAVAAGVMAEAIFIGIAVRPTLRGALTQAPPVPVLLTWRTFHAFYIPLAMTSLLTLLAQPIVSAALSRLPRALDSLAVWPVINGLVFTLRSMGLAFNEVVVSLLEEPGAHRALLRFTRLLAGITSAVLLLLAVTPLGWLWFSGVSGLSPSLARLGAAAIWVSILVPAASVYLSWYTGILVHARRTRAITESVALYLALNVALLAAAVAFTDITGIYVGLATVAVGVLGQAFWLRYRAEAPLTAIKAAERG